MAPIVAKWGNSLAIRLPMHVVKTSRLSVGDEVEISSDADGCIIVSRSRPKYDLDSLVERITPSNLHEETKWGGPKGGEVW